MGRAAGAALAILFATGCLAVGGRSRPFDPSRLGADQGWIAAAPTPVVLQEGPQDCGAAALAMVAGRWNVELSGHDSLDSVAVQPSAPHGARLGELRAVARAHGLSAFAVSGDRATLLHELRAGRPVVVGLLIPLGAGRARSHYEVVVAAHPGQDQFVTIDPATGWRARAWTELDAEWLPAGRPALVVVGAVAGAAQP
jgi:ABC-type bacteriocin/lantibiotic exporter with double-glycine peptidase domain